MIDKYRGTGVALVTPFKNGKIDEDGLVKVVEHVIDGGVEYLVALGTTGETAMLSEEEKSLVLDIVKSVNDGRLPVVAGHLTGNNTAKLVEDIQNMDFEGIDAILCASPAYVKPSQSGIVEHYRAVGNASPVPIIIYNVPGRTSSNIQVDTMCRIAALSDKFIGVKEASGNIIQGLEMIHETPDSFFVSSGDDPTSMALNACGGNGVISVIGNLFPRIFSDMTRAALDGDFVTARALNKKVHQLHKHLYVEGNPTGIKAAMEIKGICGREVRLPMTPLSDNVYAALQEELSKIG